MAFLVNFTSGVTGIMRREDSDASVHDRGRQLCGLIPEREGPLHKGRTRHATQHLRRVHGLTFFHM